MKRLLFTELSLLSQIEKKAYQIAFDPKANLVIGKNDTGKSSLIKSIFRVFGAESKNHPRWKSANVTILLKFTIHSNAFAILRYGKLFALYDDGNNLLGTYNSVTKELAPALADLFDFKLILPDKRGKLISPPPAYFFLPFYIDQDNGWVKNWNSFENLSQIPRWRKNVAEYHTGIMPNEYYKLIAEENSLKSIAEDKSNELRIQNSIYDRIDKDHAVSNFDIDINEFKAEIEELLLACEKLKLKEDALKANLTKLYNIKFHLETQIKLVEGTHSELKKDFDFANKSIEDDVECPICGALYDNSFLERFSIAEDENRCFELLQQLNNDITEVNRKISNEKTLFDQNTIESEKIREFLNIKKSEVKLNELIEVEGKREVRNIIKSDINKTQKDIIDTEGTLGILKKQKAEFNKSEKRRQILTSYLVKMRSNLFKLGVHNLAEKSYKKIDSNISEIGSDNPRALLAYFYSIINVIMQYSSTTIAPIVIDSPNQQDQDAESLIKMMSFIEENSSANQQLILATADIGRDIPFDGKRIVLNYKDSLLREDQYEQVADSLKLYLEKSLYQN